MAIDHNMNVCRYTPVQSYDFRGLNARLSLLFKEVCLLRGQAGSGVTSSATPLTGVASSPMGVDTETGIIYYEDSAGNWTEVPGDEDSAPNTVTGDYTLEETDSYVESLDAVDHDIIVPPNASVPIAIGKEIDLVSNGTGQVTVVPGVGVTILSAGNKYKLASQYSGATLKKKATNVWNLFGDLAP